MQFWLKESAEYNSENEFKPISPALSNECLPDPSEIEFPDYHRYIATPMDLSTVRESLQVGDYNSPVDFQKDVKLIFKNSKDFNTNSKSKVLGMTYKLEEWFEQRIGK